MLDTYDAKQGYKVVDWSECRFVGHYSDVAQAKLIALTEALGGHRVSIFYAWSKRLVVVYNPSLPEPDADDGLF